MLSINKIAVTILTLSAFVFTAFAECPSEPRRERNAAVLSSVKLENRAKTATGYTLKFQAAAKGTSWETKGAEAAVVSVFIDGKYNQDVILFDGATAFVYESPLGLLEPGRHLVEVVHNQQRSAQNSGKVRIRALNVTPVAEKPASPSHLAALNAPFIYLRPDTIDRFSDIPLLTFYEIFGEADGVARIRYTTIFSNEDGGTQSLALMARWGRMTDIEWIYEFRVAATGQKLSEIFQGANHRTTDFRGARLTSHPILLDATVNNNFSDTGCSAMRISPRLIPADLASGSRETVMDANPFTYRIMAQEARREKRVDPRNIGPNTIADPRDYFYVEVYNEPENTAVAVLIGDQKPGSDYGDARLRIDRTGFFRIAVRRPDGPAGTWPQRLNLVCSPVKEDVKGFCRNLRPVRIVGLDSVDKPVIKRLDFRPQTIAAGETAGFEIK